MSPTPNLMLSTELRRLHSYVNSRIYNKNDSLRAVLLIGKPGSKQGDEGKHSEKERSRPASCSSHILEATSR